MFLKSHFSKLIFFRFSTKFNKMVKNPAKKSNKKDLVPKIINTFDFSSQESKRKLVVFFSDFSHGLTLFFQAFYGKI